MMNELTAGIRRSADAIGRPVRLMEVCGTHTVAIFRHGIRELLPESITLLSGPGCPVCVTSMRDVEAAVVLSKTPGVCLVTFGDMMRVPGVTGSLYDAKAEGGDIRLVYSPLDTLAMAENEKDKKFVFFATGFETTSPLTAATLLEADRRGIENFFVYTVHKTVPPALRALLDAGDASVDGFILPGHVSAVIGSAPYDFLADDYRKPSVVTGFEASDILEGIRTTLSMLESDKAEVLIQYDRVVKRQGNPKAMAMIEEYFEPEDCRWRGIGMIPSSGLKLREKYRSRDAAAFFSLDLPEGSEPAACSCGDVLRGVKTPPDCPLFGRACTPLKPIGACMVSSEGSCGAYYKYRGAR